MRSRRKPWAHDLLNSHSKVTFDGHDLKTHWSHIEKYELICVELGSGKGDFVHQMAKLYPNFYWIAVEKDENVAARALRKVESVADNVFWVVADAKDMQEWFEPGTVQRIYLNFSDPWPKKHHVKRRLSSESFMEKMWLITRDDAEFYMKTDNQKLFEYTILTWQNYPLNMIEFSVDYRRDEHPEDAITEYEQRFMDLGQVIYRAVWRKKHDK
jgi:tRNA (guanine-N7-)-methyltransferase